MCITDAPLPWRRTGGPAATKQSAPPARRNWQPSQTLTRGAQIVKEHDDAGGEGCCSGMGSWPGGRGPQARGLPAMYLRAERGYKCLVVTYPQCGASRGVTSGSGWTATFLRGDARHVVSRSCWEDRSAVSAGADAPARGGWFALVRGGATVVGKQRLRHPGGGSPRAGLAGRYTTRSRRAACARSLSRRRNPPPTPTHCHRCRTD